MRKSAVILFLFVISSSYLSSQSLIFKSDIDTIYYSDQPFVSAVIYPASQTTSDQISGASFLLACHPGNIVYDSSEIVTYGTLSYGMDLLTISGNINGSLGFGLTGISPEINLAKHIDSLIVNIPLIGLNPDDSIIDMQLADINFRRYNGQTTRGENMHKTLVLVQIPASNISDFKDNKIKGLTASFNRLDGSIVLHMPEEINSDRYEVSIYDLCGRPMVIKTIYRKNEYINNHRLISGIYFINVRYKLSSAYHNMTAKLIIPY